MYIVQERLLVESEYRQVLQGLVSQVLLSNSIELYANIRKAKFVSCRICKLANSAADKLRFANVGMQLDAIAQGVWDRARPSQTSQAERVKVSLVQCPHELVFVQSSIFTHVLVGCYACLHQALIWFIKQTCQ